MHLKYKKLIISGCFLAIIAVACRKDTRQPLEENLSQRQELEIFKQYYQQLTNREGRTAQRSSRFGLNGRPNLKYPNWANAIYSETKTGTFVEVPLYYDERSSIVIKESKKNDPKKNLEIFDGSFDRLIIYRNKSTGKFDTKIVTYIPDIGYLRSHDDDVSHNQINKIDRDFAGYLEYKKWNGDRLYILKKTKGKSVKKLLTPTPNKLAKISSIKSNGKVSQGGYSTSSICYLEVEQWGETCIGAGPEADDPENQECTPYLIGVTQIAYDCGDGGGEDEDPCATYGIGCPTGDDCADYGIGCDTGGGGEDQPDPEPQPVDTINHVTDSCINNAIEIALGKNAGSKIKDLMAGTFLANSTTNLDFHSFPFTHNNNEAITTSGNTTNIDISFNSNRMPFLSDEYNVATVYHEVIHAYLAILWPPASPGDNILIPPDHWNMANNYVTMLAADLRAAFPNLSEAEATNLSWGGLQKTSVYQFKKLQDPAWDIEVTNTNVAYSTKGQTYTKGNYCR